MMFSEPYNTYEPDEDTVEALDLFLLLHADHEQNCSTSTVRMVASSGANLFASVAAGVCGLWGPLPRGANAGGRQDADGNPQERRRRHAPSSVNAKEGKARLMGLRPPRLQELRPRAKILGKAVEAGFANLGRRIRCWKSPSGWRRAPFRTTTSSDRKLYPNVDFYSGLLLRAIGIPLENVHRHVRHSGASPAGSRNWREVDHHAQAEIYRPRQILWARPARAGRLRVGFPERFSRISRNAPMGCCVTFPRVGTRGNACNSASRRKESGLRNLVHHSKFTRKTRPALLLAGKKPPFTARKSRTAANWLCR
jgi:citrate synthase